LGTPPVKRKAEIALKQEIAGKKKACVIPDRGMRGKEVEVEVEEEENWENAADALLSAWKCPTLLIDTNAAPSPSLPTPPSDVRTPPLDFRALGGLPAALQALGISTPTKSACRLSAAPRSALESRDPNFEPAVGPSCTLPDAETERPSEASASPAADQDDEASAPTPTPPAQAAPMPPPAQAMEEPNQPRPAAVDFQSLGGARETATFEVLGLPKLPSFKQGLRRHGSKEHPWSTPSSSARVLQPPQPPQPPAPPDIRPVAPEQHGKPERHQFPGQAMPHSVEVNPRMAYQSKAGQGEQPSSGVAKGGPPWDRAPGQQPDPQRAHHKPSANSSAKLVPEEVAQMQAAMKKHLGDAQQMREALNAQMADRERQEQEQRKIDEAKAKKAKLAEQWKRELQEAAHREEEKLRQELSEARKREQARRDKELQYAQEQQRRFREEQQRFREERWEHARARQQTQWDHRSHRSASAQRPAAAPDSSPPARRQSVPPSGREKLGVEAELETVRRDILRSMRRISSECNLDQRRQQMRDLVRNWHPDKHPADNPRQQQIATAAFQLIQANRKHVLEGGAPK